MTIRSLNNNKPVEEVKNMSTGTENGRTTFQNLNAKPVKKMKTFIPFNLLLVMKYMESRPEIDYKNEFGLYLKGDFTPKGLIVSEKYCTPPQVVSSAFIDFGEIDNDLEWNGVTHRHPQGGIFFSGTDDIHINANHEFSILFVNSEFHCGIANIPFNGYRLQVDLEIIIQYPDFDKSGINFANISERGSCCYSSKDSHGFVSRGTGRKLDLPMQNPKDVRRADLDEESVKALIKKCNGNQSMDEIIAQMNKEAEEAGEGEVDPWDEFFNSVTEEEKSNGKLKVGI